MRKSHDSGFTLLEVMVSIAILAVALTTLLMFSGNTLIKSGRAEKLLVATMLARQKMTEIDIDLEKAKKKKEFPDEKSEDGSFDEPFDDYKWKMEIRRVDLPAPVTGEEGSIQGVIGKQLTKEITKTVRELKLTVLWEEMGEEQTIDVVTHIVKLW
ncbi:MAG: type II secretion system protein [Pseudomonadota bacterium]